MTAPSIAISIIIPVYNGGESFRKCLASIRESLRCPSEVIVVSDGDTDGSWQIAEAFGAKVYRLPSSRGPARARNVGASSARGDILFFEDEKNQQESLRLLRLQDKQSQQNPTTKHEKNSNLFSV